MKKWPPPIHWYFCLAQFLFAYHLIVWHFRHSTTICPFIPFASNMCIFFVKTTCLFIGTFSGVLNFFNAQNDEFGQLVVKWIWPNEHVQKKEEVYINFGCKWRIHNTDKDALSKCPELCENVIKFGDETLGGWGTWWWNIRGRNLWNLVTIRTFGVGI
jgi:hypothetical protein